MESVGSFLDNNEWESICKLVSTPTLDNINSTHLLEYSPPNNESANFGTPCLDKHFMPMWNSDDFFLPMDFIMDPQNEGSLAFMFLEHASKERSFSDEGSAIQYSPTLSELTLKRKQPVYADPPVTIKKVGASNPTNKKGRKEKKATTEEEDPSEDGLYNTSEEDNNETMIEESDSNKSVTQTSSGKKRANRGEATDPQSLYARRRRMRINERLKILQSLVPNGTKVDISTMLEEAFHYVKFLQLQIRLLSSDDLWMYAPLAYNIWN